MPGMMPAPSVAAPLRGHPPRTQRHREAAFCAGIGRLALRSLHDELTLYPKPGLVSLVDNGSHDDMDARTFMRSLFSLRHYFPRIALAGLRGQPFAALKTLGIEAERRMLDATAGINTHRGAIFCLGMLCAAAGRCHRLGIAPTAPNLRAVLLAQWGAALAQHRPAPDARSHGSVVASVHAVSGAREEAALGFPSVFGIGLPALQDARRRTGCGERARLQALFALMAHISDSNVYYRGGQAGAHLVRTMAEAFLAQGGAIHPCWKARAEHCHAVFTRNRLSPGGAADLLAAACFVDALNDGARQS